MTSLNDSTPYLCPWYSSTTLLPIRMKPGLVSIIVSIGITFSSMAADAVTILKVEPGS